MFSAPILAMPYRNGSEAASVAHLPVCLAGRRARTLLLILRISALISSDLDSRAWQHPRPQRGESPLGEAQRGEAQQGGPPAGADFTRASFGDTLFNDVDLSEAKGLETAEHLPASRIGIDTIVRSQGKIPEVFLFGARPAAATRPA